MISAVTIAPVRDLSDLSKQRRDICEKSLMSQRAGKVYERLIVIEKRLTDHFESKTRMVLLWAWKRDIRKNVFKKFTENMKKKQ